MLFGVKYLHALLAHKIYLLALLPREEIGRYCTENGNNMCNINCSYNHITCTSILTNYLRRHQLPVPLPSKASIGTSCPAGASSSGCASCCPASWSVADASCSCCRRCCSLPSSTICIDPMTASSSCSTVFYNRKSSHINTFPRYTAISFVPLPNESGSRHPHRCHQPVLRSARWVCLHCTSAKKARPTNISPAESTFATNRFLLRRTCGSLLHDLCTSSHTHYLLNHCSCNLNGIGKYYFCQDNRIT